MSGFTDDDLTRALKGAVVRGRYANQIPALLFKPVGASTYVADVPGNQGFVYVRPVAGGWPQQAARAIDRLGVSTPTDDNKPVFLDKESDGTLIITRWRYEGS